VCDLVHLEHRGIPAVGVATAPFADEAVEQARLLGMPGCRVVYIPHPVQLLTASELAGRADAIFPDVLAALTQPPGPSP
jgi:uracil-DNA glycosylase